MGSFNDDFKTVADVQTEVEAQIIAGMLRANGIPAEVFGVSSSYPSINATLLRNGVQVKVNAADYDLALKLLNDSPAE
ncbi:MAG: DUF2007 domain-containing protein [Bacteroidales bacterium]|nr:DUF2007 domain-containing protein [Bacteroidales bacterium]